MKRVLLIGSGGAGKSTLARKMSKQLNITAFHLDKLLWKPNWQMTPKPEQAIIVHNLVRQDSWIIDGNYNGTLDIRVAAADTIVFLDRSRYVSIKFLNVFCSIEVPHVQICKTIARKKLIGSSSSGFGTSQINKKL
ncbi:hypothetical protein LQZ13_09965 [Leuconostoc mesenteroides]|uniref:hypothetical protein n=1 Tax=Leuconostoc mesenteroides TaxID=1245 RepID=UPI002115C3AE|nr:hypothetical protein [Leuconostoc mesenteroides]UUE17787.1 hypothetical protein LQZ13_09965 [Leuconostoc mesenteroides]